MQKDLTRGSVFSVLIKFSLPYLLSCFLQTFYGLADLFIIGRFNDSAAVTAVSVGSQVLHMVTVIIAGLAMGSTVMISRFVGAKKTKEISKSVAQTILIFAVFALAAGVALTLSADLIISLVSTPSQAIPQARSYLIICFAGVPFITAYNVISAVFRGMGDSKSPMFFVAVAGVVNILLDYVFIGPMAMGAAGAALATVIAQGVSVAVGLIALCRKSSAVRLSRADFRPDKGILGGILKVGVPIALQDGLVQVSFLVITAIANSRGLEVAAAVGIVEKIISFFFLVPSALLSSVSAIAAQNRGAGLHRRSRKTLLCAICVAAGFGVIMSIICQFVSPQLVGLFSKDGEVIRLGGEYLSAYVFDCIFAGIHFCFSGFFCAYGKAAFSFIQNIVSISCVRIPGAYLTSKWFPETLYPMGLSTAAGSLLSVIICICLFFGFRKKWDC